MLSDLLLHISTNGSLWTLHDTVPRLQKKYSKQSSGTIQDAIKNKLSTCSFTLGFFWNLPWMSCLNQTCQSKRSFTPFALLTTDCVLCQEANAHLYTVSIVDKIAAVIIISICFWRNVTLAFNVIKCQRLNDWMPVGGAYGEKKMTIHQCLALEAGFMQIFVLEWRHLAPKTQNETFLELD